MKCYYEVLNISKDVTDEDLKKAYRKLALKWHPDKNPDNLEQAHSEFLVVQRAYEVLSDPQERAWYDRHKESILKGAGSGYQDDSLDIFSYFSTSCYSGYDDSKNGFYTIYREVFNKLAAEESEYLTDDDTEPPEFGTSESSYEDVNRFYGYWLSFCTKKSYFWLNTYDISDAENRRILRLMEQENKKVRDKAKKERNDEIRALIAFVRKRDKRVQAYAEYLKKKTEENNRKTEEHRKKMIAQRRKDMESYKETEWSKFSNLESELKEIESNMASQFNDQSDDDSELDELMCAACNKNFKTEKAFANHEKSKKHKENVELLKKVMAEEEELLNENGVTDHSEEELEEPVSDDAILEEDSKDEENIDDSAVLKNKQTAKSKKKKKKGQQARFSDNETEIDLSELAGSKKQRKKLQREKIISEKLQQSQMEDECEVSDSGSVENEPIPVVAKSKKNKNKNKAQNKVSDEEDVDVNDLAGSKKQRRKQEREKILTEKQVTEETGECSKSNKKDKKKQKNEVSDKVVNKSTQPKTKLPTSQPKTSKLSEEQIESLDLDHSCATCNTSFDSKNKLFQHLKNTGHQIFLPTKVKSTKTAKKKK